MSIGDVARGYRSAFSKIFGEENIKDYALQQRTSYHKLALPPDISNDVALLSRFASENILNEALYFEADVVFVVSGLNLHPISLWLLKKAKIPTVVLFTESPYEDEYQKEWASTYPEMLIMTNDRFSAKKFGWTYVPHSYDPKIHYHVNTPIQYDVMMVGSGWPERQKVLEDINWVDIRLKLCGIWPNIGPDSNLYPFLDQSVVPNDKVAELYSSSKICINFHRAYADNQAYSLGPRAYEIAACESFQISDYRPELVNVFNSSVPYVKDPRDWEATIRYYLQLPEKRSELAQEAYEWVQECTFDHRAVEVVKTICDYAKVENPNAQHSW
jgi:spore maturation protein CgeB